jgi:hypothetical protein
MDMRVKYPSLELNWLPKPKDISIPDIFIVDDYNYSGCYWHPQYGEDILDGKCVSLENGLIVIKSDTSPSTIAHEFRHHLQYMNGIDFEIMDWNFNKPYKDAIKEYYTQSITEMDALLYECRLYPDDNNMQSLEWCYE